MSGQRHGASFQTIVFFFPIFLTFEPHCSSDIALLSELDQLFIDELNSNVPKHATPCHKLLRGWNSSGGLYINYCLSKGGGVPVDFELLNKWDSAKKQLQIITVGALNIDPTSVTGHGNSNSRPFNVNFGQMDSPLMEAGMDSLSSVEFRNQVICLIS